MIHKNHSRSVTNIFTTSQKCNKTVSKNLLSVTGMNLKGFLYNAENSGIKNNRLIIKNELKRK